MHKRVSVEDVFADYLAEKQKTFKPVERPFGALLRDITIQNLMRGSLETMENHEANLARETILNTQIRRIAREKQVPLSTVSKLVDRPQVDLSSILKMEARRNKQEKVVMNEQDKVERKHTRNKQKAEQAAEKAAEKVAVKGVQQFNLTADDDNIVHPMKKRRNNTTLEPAEASGEMTLQEPEGEQGTRREVKTATQSRKENREKQAKTGLPIAKENQYITGGTRERYSKLYADFNQSMPENFVPARGFYKPSKSRKKMN